MNLTTKAILFSDGKTKEMTFEEVLKQFKGAIIGQMKKANNKFIFNAVEEEDFIQILNIEAWKAYEAYDIEQGNTFSTYLFYKLQKGVRDATFSKYSLKNQGIAVSMNAPMGDDDLKLEDLFAVDDSSMTNIDFSELTAIIRENVTKDEEETLQALLNKKDFSVQNYADKHGITRQAANQRIVKLRKKLQRIISEQYLEIV